ncbi:MAG: SUMF1/EgtB/PvdO family nonheme iron enzyme [Spirochaetaceae bacterium]|jgi:formylglycine-generating enzyme required for sulfatase activity|nr:SUMF1/EgtB/PvdO family nonheme iron enzyme [Spirochaetaceae bacterium]
MWIKETRRSSETPDEDRVKLPVVLGIRPGYYLAILYGLALVVIFFFVFCYPGIVKPGALVAFISEPEGAAIRVDDLTLGSAPCEIFISRGTRNIEMVLPGFSPFKTEAVVGNRVFGSWFFPRRLRITGTLTAADPLEALRLGAVRYSEWSFAGEPSEIWQIPQELSEGAYRSGPAASDPAAREAMEGILQASLRFTVTRTGLRDLIRAAALTGNGGLSPSPVTLLRFAQDASAYLSDTPGAAVWLAGLLSLESAPPESAPPESVPPAFQAWYKKNSAGTSAGISAGTSAGNSTGIPAENSAVLELGGMEFRRIAGGSFTMQGVFPHQALIEDFWIADTEVSSESWAAFLAAHDEWSGEQRERLREQGLVTIDYLGDSPPGIAGISGVSWYAAEAYCRWLTGLLPPALASYEARLPREAEWEYAAGRDNPALEDLLGGHWEWCGDPYAPLDFFPAPPEYIRAIGSPERSLRGGAWINPPGAVGAETRASLPPDTCSAFVSFRPVIALRQNNE